MSQVDLGTRHLDARKEHGVLHVRIERPEKRNAFTQDVFRGQKRAATLEKRRQDWLR